MPLSWELFSAGRLVFLDIVVLSHGFDPNLERALEQRKVHHEFDMICIMVLSGVLLQYFRTCIYKSVYCDRISAFSYSNQDMCGVNLPCTIGIVVVATLCTCDLQVP